MKKKIIILGVIFCLPVLCYADEIQDVQCFFNQYIDAANNYSSDYFNYYVDNPTIIRVVEKSDGTQQAVKVPFERYKKEAAKSAKLAKLKRYKNKYLNINITKHGSDYKIAAMRMPSTSNYKVPAHFIVGKNSNGEWKIKEESMNTKVQRFLR